MSVFSKLIEFVENGSSFKIDLIKKNLWLGKKQIVKDGNKIEDNLFISPDDLSMMDIDILYSDPWSIAESLYRQYKYSSIQKGKLGNLSYFKALDLDGLSDYDLAMNMNRNLAQAYLEGYILCMSLSGFLKLENETHWFYQGKDKDFVVLKDWL